MNYDYHGASKQLIEKIKKEGITVILPEIILPEVSSAIARGTGDYHGFFCGQQRVHHTRRTQYLIVLST
jgi:hypothetical protein